MNLCEYLLEKGSISSPALLTLERNYSYAELASAARAVAHHLAAMGAAKGDRAFLISENGFFWVAAYLGILRVGMVCVPLSPKISPEEMESIAGCVEARFAFVEARSLPRFLPQLARLHLICDQKLKIAQAPELAVMADIIAGNNVESAAAQLLPDDLVALMFTSGSTGKPRGVMISLGNVTANTASIIAYLALTRTDRIMQVLPLHYCFGASLLHTHFRVGGSVVIEPRFMYPDTVLQRMRDTDCTGFAGVPSHYQILLRRSSLGKMVFPSLRYVQQAGGHLAPSLVRELQEILPGKQVYVMYGQTEATARLAYLPPEMLAAKPGSVGKAIPGVRLSIVDQNGAPLPPGQMGELVAEGENVAHGYWRDELETSRYFRNGRLHTGDLAIADQEGFLYIVDRAKDFVKCGGQRVSCRSLEDVLLECPHLLEAAVVGIPDAVLGEAVKAFVVPRSRDGDGLEQLVREHCRSRLALPLIPKQIMVVPALPKNSSGKVLKQLLREATHAQ